MSKKLRLEQRHPIELFVQEFPGCGCDGMLVLEQYMPGPDGKSHPAGIDINAENARALRDWLCEVYGYPEEPTTPTWHCPGCKGGFSPPPDGPCWACGWTAP